MLHNFYAEYLHIRIRPLVKTDLEYLRIWRNDKTMNQFLKPIDEITPEMQKEWFDRECKDPSSYTFAIEEIKDLNRIVGSVAIYDIKGKTAEAGKIVVGDPAAKGKKIGYYALILAMYVGYEKLGIETYLGEVHEENMSAKTNDLRMGFIVTGKHPFVTGGFELEMKLPKKHFWKTHDFLSDIKVYECNEPTEKKDMSGYKVGQTGRFSKTLMQSDVYNFAGIVGDFNPIHINSVEAKKSVFGKQVVHGMLTASLLSTVIGTIMPGESSIYLSQELKFLKPVFFGDTVTAEVQS